MSTERHMYATGVPPDFISAVTDAVLAEVIAWQKRFIINIALQLHKQNPGQSQINRST